MAVAALFLNACVSPPKDTAPLLIERAPVGAQVDRTPRGFAWPAAGWWKAFGDPQLDELIRRALISAPGIQTAQARVTAAHAATVALAADSGIRLGVNAGLSRQRLSDTALIGSRVTGIEWYTQADAALRLDVDFDWWGRERARLMSGVNRERAALAERKAAELLLATSITTHYLAWQTYTRRFENARKLEATLQQAHRLQMQRVQQGIDPPESLAPLLAEQAQANYLSTVVEGAITVEHLQMAALAGIAPERVPLAKRGRAVVPYMEQPADAGLGILSRRPDIVASRWSVEAASQGVAEAVAGYYPDIRLSAFAGLSSTEISKFFNTGSRVAGIGGVLYLPIFDARRVKARYGGQRAELELAIARYNETVVAAALDVGLQVLNWQGLPRLHGYRLQQLEQARVTERAVAARAAQGIEDERSVLKARADVLRLQDSVTESDGGIAAARIALIKSLGGGSDVTNPEATPKSPARSKAS